MKPTPWWRNSLPPASELKGVRYLFYAPAAHPAAGAASWPASNLAFQPAAQPPPR